jgi:hypothetical protein
MSMCRCTKCKKIIDTDFTEDVLCDDCLEKSLNDVGFVIDAIDEVYLRYSFSNAVCTVLKAARDQLELQKQEEQNAQTHHNQNEHHVG